jgi:hypothetical protein
MVPMAGGSLNYTHRVCLGLQNMKDEEAELRELQVGVSKLAQQ